MPREKRSRRGSTIVMVALMLVALASVGAIAADIGRFYVVAGELQTAADAAALKGAAVLQVTTGNTPKPTIDPAVIAWVNSTNLSDGTTPTITSDSIHMAFYTPASTNGNTVTPATLVLDPPGRPNAVYVAVYTQPKGVFAQLMGRTTGLQIPRRAVAWIANVSLSCIRPFAFPYTPFYKKVTGLANVTTPAPDVTAAQMVNYQQNGSLADKTFIVTPPGTPYPFQYPNDSSWRGYNPPSSNNGNANSGKTTFQNFLTDCSGVSVNGDAGAGNTVPNQGSGNGCGAPEKTACWTSEVIDTPQSGGNGNNSGQNQPICAQMRANDAGCYATAADTAPGVTVDMAWSDIVGNGQSVDFRYVGEFTFMCFFKNTTDTCNAIQGSQKTGYPVGTIVGVAAGLKSRTLNPTDILSNSPSNVQRIMLVK